MKAVLTQKFEVLHVVSEINNQHITQTFLFVGDAAGADERKSTVFSTGSSVPTTKVLHRRFMDSWYSMVSSFH